MWSLKTSFDVPDIIAEAAITAVAALIFALFACLAHRREKRALLTLATFGAFLYLIGSLCDLIDEFIKVPDLMKHWVENFSIATGSAVIILVVALLLPQVLAEVTTDHLTGLLNRRATEHVLRRELARAARYNLPLAVPHTDTAGAAAVARRLDASWAALHAILGFPVSAAFGAAFYPDDGNRVEELLAAADRRMYEEKRRRQGDTMPFPPEAPSADS